MQSKLLRAWNLGLATSHGVPSPKYGMDAHMAFLEVMLKTCVESWVDQKVRPNSQHKSREPYV